MEGEAIGVAKGECSIEDCTRPSRTRGWCKAHYVRERRYGDPLAVRPPNGREPRPLEERFAEKVRRGGAGECRFMWSGCRDKVTGYGKISRGGRLGNVGAHRVAYTLAYERAIPEGLVIDHLCGKGPSGCVTPEHLEVVTHGENTRRALQVRWHGA